MGERDGQTEYARGDVYVVVIHGPSDAPEIVGPFETFEKADAWGKAILNPRDDAWYVQRVIAPEQAEV